LYVYFGALAVGYLAVVFIRSGGMAAEGLLADAESLFMFVPVLVGGYLFSALYTDDLHSRNLSVLIGFGMGKGRIVVCKLILMAVCGAVVFGLIPLYMYAVFAVFGHAASASMLAGVYVVALKGLLSTFAFSALSAIVVYGLQRATFGMVLYVLLSLGVVSQLFAVLFSLELISSVIPGLAEHLMSGITLRIMAGLLNGESIISAVVEYVIYVAAAALLSVFAFRKKELEF
jgi:hypothetical protein